MTPRGACLLWQDTLGMLPHFSEASHNPVGPQTV